MEEQHPLLITNTASCFKGLTATATLSPDKEQFLTHTSKGASLLAFMDNKANEKTGEQVILPSKKKATAAGWNKGKHNKRIGETITATNGQRMTIIAYRGCNDIDVEFEDGTVVKHKAVTSFKRGNIANPNMGRNYKERERLGASSIATNGQRMTIIAYRGCNDIDVEFEDGTVVSGKTIMSFKNGNIANPTTEAVRKSRHEGEKKIAMNGEAMTLIKYRTNADIDVMFEDGTVVKNRQYGDFLRGRIGKPRK